MCAMRKFTSVLLLALLLMTMFTGTAFADDKKEIKFGENIPEGYSELAWHTPSYSFQFWHYSGGYWGNETYGIKLTDAQVAEGIENNRVIEYELPVTIIADLPQKVQDYLKNGGNIDDVLIKFELTNGLRDTDLFGNVPTYSINNKQITLSFQPKFNITREHLVDLPGMNVYVPIIPAKFGQMVYAMYTPNGKHLGQGGNIEPGDIIDCNGNLREGKMYEYHMANQPSQYLPGGKIKIGDGTFANGGAVGLQFPFPIKATYYVPSGPDFFSTPQGSEQWKPEYKDPNKCAMDYTYKEGQKNITFPITLRNQGEKAITDFKAVWYGSSKANPNTWNQPLWEAEIKEPIEKDKPVTYDVTIPLPAPDYSKGIVVFKANIDGKTPDTESNLDNNMTFIKLIPEGVDVEVYLGKDQEYLVMPGEKADVRVMSRTMRLDEAPTDINIDFDYSDPAGVIQKQYTLLSPLKPEATTIITDRKMKLGPGTYYVKISAWPIGVPDTNPKNNTATKKIIVKQYKPDIKDLGPVKISPDKGTRVNLRS